MDSEHGHRVAIVGAGPRGLSVLERLLARLPQRPQERKPQIHLIDPFPPGPGHVWRHGQSRLFLMNTPSLFPTVVPGDGLDAGAVPSVAGLTFDAWREGVAAGSIGGVPAEDRDEAAALAPSDFPSRLLYGRYLAWIFSRLAEEAGARAALSVHTTEAVRLYRHGGGYRLDLADGGELEADAVVLALGHLPTALNPEQQRLQDEAARFGLHYLPPNVPPDLDFKRIPAGRTVLVRGMGLNFFDVMIQLTEGRGGKFLPASDSEPLRYLPSGKEPRLVAASRRGTPYRAKARLESYLPTSLDMRWFTPAAARLFAETGVQPGFDHDLWPLLQRDVLWAYYSTLVRVEPQAVSVPARDFLDGLQELFARKSTPGSRVLLNAVHAYLAERILPERLLDVEALAKPFAGRKFASAEEYQAAMLGYLEADAAGSARGEDDPLKMAIGALNAGRSLLKEIVADGGLTEESWLAELRGWFEPLVEGLASGPPAQRIEQLAALARAGLVDFVGPDPHFEVEPETGRFRATSPWVDGASYSGAYLVEAMMPANRVAHNVSPLLRHLLEDGLARTKLMLGPDRLPVPTSGLDVTLPPYRAVGANGQPTRNLYVLGLQLSSAQWGTAIAAEAGAPPEQGSRTLKDADDIAGHILGAAEDPLPVAGGFIPPRLDEGINDVP
ncbi:FAD/NAD(P)-binding domain-containing protein [Arthrobacter sp. Marseille-P9274]|uniref:FAD/NAD(P)-binding protein n=1 Tax=Arthrobacter sp. Marseille-P9274 TaxID=2866572 RepID=UPI0021C8A2AD|nr:FAD/NAD(P)-binding domain-containing protein [Arthrobacter sp. Marseille-P9274]